jgi:hypothetical protein
MYRTLVHLHRGDSLTGGGQLDDAHVAFQHASEIAEPFVKQGNLTLFIMFMRANQRLALNAVARGRRTEALTFAGRVLEVGENPPTSAPSARAQPRARSAMGLTYAALASSRVGEPADREQARSWLKRALESWEAVRTDPAFAVPHQREMREIEEALARLERR